MQCSLYVLYLYFLQRYYIIYYFPPVFNTIHNIIYFLSAVKLVIKLKIYFKVSSVVNYVNKILLF